MQHGGNIYGQNDGSRETWQDHSVNLNPLGIPESVRQALIRATDYADTYPDPSMLRLRNAIQGAWKQEGVSLSVNRIAVGNGASELILNLIRTIHPRKVLLPIPCFTGYLHALQAAGITPTYCKSEELIQAIDGETELVIVANPCNPTGKRTSPEEMRNLLAACKKHNTYLLVDECFLDFCENPVSMASELETYAGLFVVRAFTKTYAIPGVRIGYLLGAPDLICRLQMNLPEWNVSVYAEEAGIACLKEREHIHRAVKYLASERERICRYCRAHFQESEFRLYESDANYFMVQSVADLDTACKERRIRIRDLSDVPGLSQGYYRFAIRSREEDDGLLDAFSSVLKDKV